MFFFNKHVFLLRFRQTLSDRVIHDFAFYFLLFEVCIVLSIFICKLWFAPKRDLNNMKCVIVKNQITVDGRWNENKEKGKYHIKMAIPSRIDSVSIRIKFVRFSHTLAVYKRPTRVTRIKKLDLYAWSCSIVKVLLKIKVGFILLWRLHTYTSTFTT